MDNKLQVSNNLVTVSENQIVKAALEAKLVKQAIPYEIDSCVSVAIDKAIFYLGLKTIGEDRDMIKITVIDDAKRHFTNLTIAEIGVAIENGSKGMYGEVKGLAPKDAFNWLTAYSVSEVRKSQMAELAKQSEPAPEPTAEEKRALRWYNMLKAWETFKKDKTFNDHGNSVYTTLVNNGRLKYPKSKVVDFLQQALREVKAQYNPLQHVGNPIKANEYKSIIKEIELRGKANSRVKVAARKLMLNDFFLELANMEMEITDLFAE